MFDTIKAIPIHLTEDQRRKEFFSRIDRSDETDAAATLLLHRPDVAGKFPMKSSVSPILSPPVHNCIKCNKPLTSSHRTNVVVYTMSGASEGQKYTQRCKGCNLMYRYAHFGNSTDGFTYYDTARDLVEVSDTMYFSRTLLELQCSLA